MVFWAFAHIKPMSKNTGKPSEKAFTDALKRLGKRAYHHRFVDASEIKGKTGKIAVAASPQPSDYLVVIDGDTHFAEVKSTQSVASFPFSLLNTNQTAAARMILAAGGGYWVYAHSLILNKWFRFPYSLVTQTKEGGKASIKWSDLSSYEWTLPNG